MTISFTPVCSHLETNQTLIKACRFSADYQYVLTCGSDKTIKLVNLRKDASDLHENRQKVENRRIIHCFIGHGGVVNDCDGSGDNSYLVSGSSDKTVILWDVSQTKVLRKYRSHFAAVNEVAFFKPIVTPDAPDASSRLMASCSVDGSCKLWDTRVSQVVQSVTDATDNVTSIKFLCNGSVFITGSMDGKIRYYDIRKGLLDAYSFMNGVGISFLHVINDQTILIRFDNLQTFLFDFDELINEYSIEKQTDGNHLGMYESIRQECGHLKMPNTAQDLVVIPDLAERSAVENLRKPTNIHAVDMITCRASGACEIGDHAGMCFTMQTGYADVKRTKARFIAAVRSRLLAFDVTNCEQQPSYDDAT